MSSRQNWRTPLPVFKRLDRLFGEFRLDAAADEGNALCPKFYTERDNALEQKWGGRVWVNIPFGEPMPWVIKARAEVANLHCHSVTMLCLANISAEWFHTAWGSAELLLPSRRITYWHPHEKPGSFNRDSVIFHFSRQCDPYVARPWACPEHAESNRKQWQEANGQSNMFAEPEQGDLI